MPAVIALFTYSRLEHTRQTVDALLNNAGAADSELIIFSDAARNPEKQADVLAVRRYLATIAGFRRVTIHYRPSNFGLAKSIISGVSDILQQYESVIVLEDDMVTSPFFLNYMNDALERFAEDERVVSIHGYVYPVQQVLPEAFFLPGADCWGWATWRRGWACFNEDGQFLLNELKRKRLLYEFDYKGSYPYSTMLRNQIAGTNDSWAIRWYASAFLAGKLTLYPGRSLVKNIGNDASGTHCDAQTLHDVVLSSREICLNNIDVGASEYARQAFSSFFAGSQTGLLAKLRRHIGYLWM